MLLWHLCALGAALFVGAAVQGVAGLGVGLLTAPVAGLIEPSLLPGVPLWFAAVYPLLTLGGETRHIDWRGLAWAMPWRVPGTAVGVAVVAYASDRSIGVVVGTMVLLSVVLSVRTVRVRISRPSLSVAGFVSGITGTATSIGGPPLALLYQRRAGPELRATMGVYFVFGATVSLAGLGLSGDLHLRDFWIALALAPMLVCGFVLSRVLRAKVPAAQVRTAMLTVCAASSVALILRSLA